jgi:hypothetical protein
VLSSSVSPSSPSFPVPETTSSPEPKRQPRRAAVPVHPALRRCPPRHRSRRAHPVHRSISPLHLRSAAATRTTSLRRRRRLQPHLAAVLVVGAPRDDLHRLRRLEGKPDRYSISLTPHRNSTPTVNPRPPPFCHLRPPTAAIPVHLRLCHRHHWLRGCKGKLGHFSIFANHRRNSLPSAQGELGFLRRTPAVFCRRPAPPPSL